MKTTDQAMTELALDEIKFDGNKKYGSGKKTEWTRHQFGQMVEALKENAIGARISATEDPESNDTISVDDSVDWETGRMVASFAMNCGIDLTPQWLIRFDSVEEAKKSLMEGWAVDALAGKWEDKI